MPTPNELLQNQAEMIEVARLLTNLADDPSRLWLQRKAQEANANWVDAPVVALVDLPAFRRDIERAFMKPLAIREDIKLLSPTLHNRVDGALRRSQEVHRIASRLGDLLQSERSDADKTLGASMALTLIEPIELSDLFRSSSDFPTRDFARALLQLPGVLEEDSSFWQVAVQGAESGTSKPLLFLPGQVELEVEGIVQTSQSFQMAGRTVREWKNGREPQPSTKEMQQLFRGSQWVRPTAESLETKWLGQLGSSRQRVVIANHLRHAGTALSRVVPFLDAGDELSAEVLRNANQLNRAATRNAQLAAFLVGEWPSEGREQGDLAR